MSIGELDLALPSWLCQVIQEDFLFKDKARFEPMT